MTPTTNKKKSGSRSIRVGAKLRSLVSVLTDAEKIITPRLTSYLATHDDQYSDTTARFVYNQLSRPKPVRSGRFGASSAGTCPRSQVYSYLGVPTTSATDAGLQAIFSNGTWSHLRMQSTLLDAGIIDDAEVDTDRLTTRSPKQFPLLRGTMDGVGTVPDDHVMQAWRGKRFGLEFKTANSFVFNHMTGLDDPAEKYYGQVARYLLATDLDLIVILIEEKNLQRTHEIVVQRPTSQNVVADYIDDQERELAGLHTDVLFHQLPPQLPSCAQAKGEYFRECPYGGSVANACHELSDYRSAAESVRRSQTVRAARVRIRRSPTRPQP